MTSITLSKYNYIIETINFYIEWDKINVYNIYFLDVNRFIIYGYYNNERYYPKDSLKRISFSLDYDIHSITRFFQKDKNEVFIKFKTLKEFYLFLESFIDKSEYKEFNYFDINFIYNNENKKRKLSY